MTAVGDRIASGALVEREAVLRRIGAALAEARSGRGRTACVEGAPGVGKSSVVAALANAPGVLTLAARGRETERELPFGAIRALLGPALAELPVRSRAALLRGPARAAAVVVDESRAPVPVPDMAGAVLHGLFHLLARLAARRPLLLVLDDAHWADDASLKALAYLAARIESHPIMLLCALRPVDAGAAAGLRELAGERATLLARLDPLSEAGTAQVVRARLGADASQGFCAACHRSTGGNPELLRELLAELEHAGLEPDDDAAAIAAAIVPANVTRAVLLRLARLPPAARSLARAVAVLERGELRHAAALAALDEAAARDAVEALTGAGILAPGLPLELLHPLVREALYAEIPAGARDVDHHRAAELLAAEPATRERAAAHLLICEPRGEDWACAALRAAGADALRRGAPQAAARALARAAAECPGAPPPELLVQLGAAQAAAGDSRGARTLEAAIASARDAAARAEASNLLAQVEFLGGAPERALRRVRDALQAPDLPPASRELLERDYLLLGWQEPEHAGDVRARIAGRAEPRPAHGPAYAAQLALASFYAGDPASTVVRRACLAVRETPGEEGGVVSPNHYLMGVYCLAGADAFDEADAAAEALLHRARELGSRLLEALTTNLRLWSRWRRGELRGAIDDARTVLAAAGGGVAYESHPARLTLCDLLLDAGRPGEAAEVLAPAAEAIDGALSTQASLWARVARARLRLDTGDPAGALADALDAGRACAELGIPNPGHAPWGSLAARAAAALGDVERARALAAQELRRARRFGAPRTLGPSLTARGLAESDPGAGLPWLEEAAAVLASSPALVERSRALLELGAALRRARRRRDARAPLREALELALGQGAFGIAQRARSELAATGARPRRERLAGPAALTPRERELADLAAAGLSNPEIAARLVITRSTVEAHLRSIYRKLGIGSRRELPRALAG